MSVERGILVSTSYDNDTISAHVSTSGVGGGDSKVGTRRHPGRRKLRSHSLRKYRRCRDWCRLSLKRLSLVGGCLLCLAAIAPLPLAARKVGLALLVNASSEPLAAVLAADIVLKRVGGVTRIAELMRW
jgi:hypothetical protein